MNDSQPNAASPSAAAPYVPPIPSALAKGNPSFGTRVKRFFVSRGMTLFGAVILPVFAFAVGLMFNADPWLNEVSPIPNWSSAALVAFVIIANLFLWIAAGAKLKRGFGFIGALNAASITIALFFSLKCIPHMIGGTLVCIFAIIFYGAGLLGLVAYGPLTAFIYGLVLRRRLAAPQCVGQDAQSTGAMANSSSRPRLPGAIPGVVIGIALLLLGHSHGFVALCGVRLAASQDPATSARGVRLLRVIHADNNDIHRIVNGVDLPFMPNFSRLLFAETLDHVDKDLLFYRVTGRDPEYRWSRRSMLSSFDRHVGETTVGGVVEGLSIDGSIYETTVDASCGLGYAEWTMTFGNTRGFDQEARARLVLPHGAVVSRLTLWVNGEEREAAFGGRGDTTAAYQSIVRRNRDPVLVTSCGPDQVLVQCFPVTIGDATMKIRLGMTIPLSYRADGSAVLQTPVFAAENFSIPASLLGMPEEVVVPDAASRLAPIAYCQDVSSGTNAPMAIVQQVAATRESSAPGKLVVVVDGSAALKPHAAAISAAVEALSATGNCELWFVGDDEPKAPVPSSDVANALSPRNFAGGRFNLRTLAKALDEATANGGNAQVLWIHGPQPIAAGAADVLASKLRNAPDGVSFASFQLVPGPCKLLSALDGVPNAAAFAWRDDAADAQLADALDALAKGDGAPAIERRRMPAGDVPSEAEKGSDHIGRLWALEEVIETYRPGKPTTIDPAKKIACGWHIVSPVSGAVVLETAQQFKDNGLEQVEPESVPTVPEPKDIVCLLAVALVFAIAIVFRAKKRRAVFG